MADHHQAIIGQDVASEAHAREVADTIVAWLVDERIIDDRPWDQCNGDEGRCYPPGPGFPKACTDVGPDKFDDFHDHSCPPYRADETLFFQRRLSAGPVQPPTDRRCRPFTANA